MNTVPHVRRKGVSSSSQAELELVSSILIMQSKKDMERNKCSIQLEYDGEAFPSNDGGLGVNGRIVSCPINDRHSSNDFGALCLQET
jgi:hypothetical protein